MTNKYPSFFSIRIWSFSLFRLYCLHLLSLNIIFWQPPHGPSAIGKFVNSFNPIRKVWSLLSKYLVQLGFLLWRKLSIILESMNQVEHKLQQVICLGSICNYWVQLTLVKGNPFFPWCFVLSNQFSLFNCQITNGLPLVSVK